MTGRREGEGAALVMVLAVALLVGLIALSMAFTVTLDSLAARNVQEAALAEGLAEGALELAVARIAEAAANGLPYGSALAPTDLAGLDADVAVSRLSDDYELTSVAKSGRSTVRREARIRFDAGGRVTVASRP